MKILSFINVLVILLALCQSVHGETQKANDQPLKALLYGYLPAANTSDPTFQYQQLSYKINSYLMEKGINVIVKVCDQAQSDKLYNPTLINSLFDAYDIVQLDVVYLWAVNVDLLTFTKQDINKYYDKVFQFQWEPLTRSINGEDSFIGSPGLLCSTFLETRRDKPYLDRYYGKQGAYELTALYLSLYINGQISRNLQNIDYSKVDPQTISQLANFLKNCQSDTSKFDFSSNWCLNYKKTPFLQTNFSTTTAYSQNLFNLINGGIDPSQLSIEHITKDQLKKIFYSDSFVAKSASDKKTVLQFYQFMASDKVIDIYVEGLYTQNPSKTYLIPPTIHYLDNLRNTDPLYGSIYKTAFQDKIKYVLYQEQYANNRQAFNTLIRNELLKYKPLKQVEEHSSQSSSESL